MTLKLLAAIVACAFSILATSDAAEAARKHKRNLKPLPRAAVSTFQQSPAHMIEIRPGQWISSWGCYTDEGNGRVGTCDRREGAN
jgi:hypothetical protein